MRALVLLNSVSGLLLVSTALKSTVLLVLAWGAHGVLRKSDARWRITLWRTVLGLLIFLPLLGLAPLPLLKIPVLAQSPAVPTEISSPTPSPALAPGPAAQPLPEEPNREVSLIPSSLVAPGHKVPSSMLDWSGLLQFIWGLGLFIGLARSLWWQRKLWHLVRNATAAPEIQRAMETMQRELSVRRSVSLRISPEAHSPFLSGIVRPVIVLPASLDREGLSPKTRAVLRHELAHLKHHDLVWTIGWHAMKILFWFHPLFWKVSAAHSLACEEEADRVAAGNDAERPHYAQLLAQVALDAVRRGIPAFENHLTLNGATHIVRRLQVLRNDNVLVWRPRHTVIAGALASLLATGSAGWELSQADTATATQPKNREWREIAIIVRNEEGGPIADATIEPYSFRVKGVDSASAHNWLSFGPRLKSKTDSEGKALLHYPVVAFPEEKQLTSKISLIVSHSAYPTVTSEISVEAQENTVTLLRGGALELSAYYGADHQPVRDITANLSGDPAPRWHEIRPGLLKSEPLRAGEFLLQVMGKLPTGEIVHSEATALRLTKGQSQNLAVELKPGIRLEGLIDRKVSRPVHNGRAIITVRSKQFPAVPVVEDYYEPQKRYGYFHHWTSYRPIREDGTFVFESLPPGEADVIVMGDGFISQNGTPMKNRINGHLADGPPFGFPQSFPLATSVTRITVATEPTATLRVSAKTPTGTPIQGATIYLNPNVMRIGTGLFGALPRNPGEEPFQDIESLPEPHYSAVTDAKGVAVLKDVPPFLTMLDISHPDFQVPLRESPARNVHFKLTPGETRTLDLVLQPKGKDFLGEIQ